MFEHGDYEVFSDKELRWHLRRYFKKHGIARWCFDHHLNAANVSSYLGGDRPPPPRLLLAMGLGRAVVNRSGFGFLSGVAREGQDIDVVSADDVRTWLTKKIRARKLNEWCRTKNLTYSTVASFVSTGKGNPPKKLLAACGLEYLWLRRKLSSY